MPSGVRVHTVVALFVATGCDYISFFFKHTQRQFFTTLLASAHFVAGEEGTCLGSWCFEDGSGLAGAEASFLRLVCAQYFRTHSGVMALGTIDQMFNRRTHRRGRHTRGSAAWTNTTGYRPAVRCDASSSVLWRFWKRGVRRWSLGRNTHAPPEQRRFKPLPDGSLGFEHDTEANMTAVGNRIKRMLSDCGCKTSQCKSKRCGCRREGVRCGPKNINCDSRKLFS